MRKGSYRNDRIKMIPSLFKMYLYTLKLGRIYAKMPMMITFGLQIMAPPPTNIF